MTAQPQKQRSLTNLVAAGLQAGESDFEIQQRVLEACPDLAFADFVRALARARQRPAAAAIRIPEGRG